jgi:hypothetical protein
MKTTLNPKFEIRSANQIRNPKLQKNKTGIGPDSNFEFRTSFGIRISLFGLFLLLAFSTSAQTYSIDWFKVAGGGGTSTSGQYSLSGTIGQHDAGGPLTGGNYSLTGGFWALYSVPTVGAPKLRIFLTSTNTAVVAWPSPATGWKLQQDLNLSTATWTTPTEPVNDNGTEKFIIVKPPTGNRFYRLSLP